MRALGVATGEPAIDYSCLGHTQEGHAARRLVAIVLIPKEQVLEFVKGDIDVMQRASNELPKVVDPRRDAAILERFGIDSSELHGLFNGISDRQQADN